MSWRPHPRRLAESSNTALCGRRCTAYRRSRTRNSRRTGCTRPRAFGNSPVSRRSRSGGSRFHRGAAGLAHAADLAHVDHHADLHGNIKLICAAFQLLAHALPLPGVPVRHVGETRPRRSNIPAYQSLSSGIPCYSFGKLSGCAFALHFPPRRRQCGHL